MRFSEAVKYKGQVLMFHFSAINITPSDVMFHVVQTSPGPRLGFYMEKKDGKWEIEKYIPASWVYEIERELSDIIQKSLSKP